MKIDFLGIPIDALTMRETINLIDKTIQTKSRISHVAINAAKVVSMQTNSKLFNSVVTCDLINADGQSIVWAARFLGKDLPCRVAGCDLMQELVKLAYEKKYRCFFFGASEECVTKVVEIYTKQYSPDIIAGYRNGFFNTEDEPEIAGQISRSGANFLFVAIPSPRKENFLFEYKDELKEINFTMGVGGTFDIISGVTTRAPLWLQKIGMEWFYRLVQEPQKMWKRYLIGNSKFIWLVIQEKIRYKKQKILSEERKVPLAGR
jgi:N-acetylglucosaminyldiphosphoundecaprenol N-acetyl-beta-D-mannosaminyltransferase